MKRNGRKHILSNENRKFLRGYYRTNLPNYFRADISQKPRRNPNLMFSDLEDWDTYYRPIYEDYPDWTFYKANQLIKRGKRRLKVYSVLPIMKGTPVSPSKRFMEDYGEPRYSKTMDFRKIAWSSNMLGQALQ